MKRFVIFIAFALFCIFVTSISSMAASDIQVNVNNVAVAFPDQKPFINSDNRTMVPVRFISERLGAKVDWIGETQTVKITQEGKLITLTIGSKIASVGSEQVTLDTSAGIVNSRTMVPLRFVSECLGAQVEWVQATQTINIFSANYLEDAALIDSDLQLATPPTGNSAKIELSVTVQYKYTTPVEPQMADLKEIIFKHLGSEGDQVYAYAETKTSGEVLLHDKTWSIQGKTVKVDDSGMYLGVTIWTE